MEQNNPEKWHEIALMYFDRQVMKFLSGFCPLIDDDGIINPIEIECIAQLMSCDHFKLMTVVANSLDRESRLKPKYQIELEDEKEIIKAAIKLLMKESPISLLDQKREFGKIVRELNHHSFKMVITVPELTRFLEPLCHEAFLEKCNELGRTDLSSKKSQQLAIANFDRYVLKRMVEVKFVVVGGKFGINKRDLGNLAKTMNCSQEHLRAAVVNSCSRLTKERYSLPISPENEFAVMKAAAKLHIKEVSVPMKNYKREFGKIARELNSENVGLHTTITELVTFIEPLYHEAISEIYSA